MKLIALTGKNGIGKYAMVDDNNYDLLIESKWHYSKGYAVTYDKVNKKHIRMHRLIMHTPEHLFVDHINHDTLDNQKHNLRNCTHRDNMRNYKPRGGTSKYTGVHLQIDKPKYINKSGTIISYDPYIRWMSRITINNKKIVLGRFKTEIEAAIAYNEAAKKYFGQYANLNRI